MKKSTALGISRSGGARNPHVFQYTLRFLRSGGTRPPFARDDFFTNSEPFLVEKQSAIMPQRADAPVVLLLCLCFTRAEDEPRITGNVESVELEIRGPINKEWAPVIDRQIRFPLGVGELRLWLAEVLRERRQARAQIGILGEQRGHCGSFRHGSGCPGRAPNPPCGY